MATLGDEIDHVSAYLRIEEARFAGRLQVEIAAPEAARRAELPAFSCSRWWKTRSSTAPPSCWSRGASASPPAATRKACG